MTTNEGEMLREIFDALPSMIFVVDKEVRIQEYNAAAAEFIRADRSIVLQQRAGDILRCVHAAQVSGGCGGSPNCKVCIIKTSVMRALRGKRVVRHRTRIEILREGRNIEIYALVTVSQFSFRGTPHALLVIEDISEIAELFHMIVICPVCGKVRDSEKTWMRVEAYFKNNWNVECSHGYCPECFRNEMKKIRFSSQGGQDLPIIE